MTSHSINRTNAPDPVPYLSGNLLRFFPNHSYSALKGVEARPTQPSDYDFLQQLYASTRMEEMTYSGWPEAKQRVFLAQQFTFQHRYYQEHYKEAHFLLLLRHGLPIGRLYWWASQLNASLIDISLIPEARGHGIGTAIMGILTEYADSTGHIITLHVEPTNPAHHLYHRFGFETIANNGVYLKMRRHVQTKSIQADLASSNAK